MSLNIQDGTVDTQKRYFVKFYDSNGSYLGTEDDISFDGFDKTINGGMGVLGCTLARPFDDFSEGTQIDFMNEIQLWIVDAESGASGTQIYSGFIDTYEPFVTGNEEGVNVMALGYTTRMSDVMFKNGTTVSIAKNSTDPGQMVRDILDRLAAEDSLNKITYTNGTVDLTSNSASYTFNLKSCLESIEKARTFAPVDWYWYVGADNVLYFKDKPSEATHTFTFGKDVSDIRVNKNIRDVVNRTVLWNGQTGGSNLLRSYSNSASISSYGLRMENKTDSRWGSSGTMDNVGNAFISARKDPNVKVSLRIIDSNLNNKGYDIESIDPGDTCKVLNLPDSSTTLNSNMTITRVKYTPGYVDLELEELRQTLSKKFVDISRQLNNYIYNDNDAGSYTDV